MFDSNMMRALGRMMALQARERAKNPETTSDEIIDLAPLLKKWTPGPYAIGDVIAYEGIPYHCVQVHDSTLTTDQTPEAATSLWFPYHATSATRALPWRAPVGIQDAYNKGEYMAFTDNIIYECLEDSTIWGPDTSSSRWRGVDK